MGLLKKILGRGRRKEEKPALGKPGARAYAVGDIHGRLDLLEILLARIEADVASREDRETVIVFLGDLIDRGPDSAGVVERLSTFQPDYAETVFLAGNHEELMLRILEGDTKPLRQWLRYGGAECVESYGVSTEELLKQTRQGALEMLRAHVPSAHLGFLRSMEDTFRFGEYLFVHAGIRPGVSLEEQSLTDLRWIREPFLSHDDQHGFMVVHGHTIVDQVEERFNRIAIDTGAYNSGVLTALAVEDDRRWYLSGDLDDGMETLFAAQ